MAHEAAEPGDVVLLSPGGTSFDEFKDFEETRKEIPDMGAGTYVGERFANQQQAHASGIWTFRLWWRSLCCWCSA